MFIRDFVPFVEERLHLVDPPRAVLGWSMGGYGALLAAEQSPRTFGAVLAASPALWRSYEAASPGAFDDARDFRDHDVFRSTAELRGTAVRIDCGRDDPFYPAVRAFARRLPGKKLATFGAGFHDASYWRSIAPAQLDTVANALDLTMPR